MAKYFTLFACFLLCNSCCTKKKCIGPELPFIVIVFNDLDQGSNNHVVIYTMDNGAVRDSSSSDLWPGAPPIHCHPFETYVNMPGRSYTIKWNNKQQTITDLSCDFRQEKVKCNECFPFGDGSELLQTYSNFTFQSGNKTFHQSDTLYLGW